MYRQIGTRVQDWVNVYTTTLPSRGENIYYTPPSKTERELEEREEYHENRLADSQDETCDDGCVHTRTE